MEHPDRDWRSLLNIQPCQVFGISVSPSLCVGPLCICLAALVEFGAQSIKDDISARKRSLLRFVRIAPALVWATSILGSVDVIFLVEALIAIYNGHSDP